MNRLSRAAQARRRPAAVALATVGAVLLASCSTPRAPAPGASTPPVAIPGPARWTAVPWSALPGWNEDALQAWWSALLRSCERPAAGWSATCAQARALQPAGDAQIRQWAQVNLQPWRLSASAAADGAGGSAVIEAPARTAAGVAGATTSPAAPAPVAPAPRTPEDRARAALAGRDPGPALAPAAAPNAAAISPSTAPPPPTGSPTSAGLGASPGAGPNAPASMTVIDPPGGIGLATGYFEPEFDASRLPQGEYQSAIHSAPADLRTRRPWWTRGQMQTEPQAIAALRGREIAYLRDPLDLMMMQVQGSGRLKLLDTDGRLRDVRVAFAGHNDQPFRSPGRWLSDLGEIRPGTGSWDVIRRWAAANPQRLPELLASNPRVVFFREEALPDPTLGPRGAQGVPLTPMRSVAVDPKAVPYGTPLWVSTIDPLSGQPLQRAVVAQDTGSAIVGAVRIDYFWGWGETALQGASRMKQPLRMWALWPAGTALPSSAVR